MKKTKIMILGSASSIHIYRWVQSIIDEGLDVILVTQHSVKFDFDNRVKVYELKYQGLIGYYLNSFSLRRLIYKENPDLIHAHYASGYGTTLRLSGTKKPNLLSVWGSDIYLFPRKSLIHKSIIKRNLKFSKNIASTSLDMKKEIEKYINKEILLTPFGVDINHFKPYSKNNTDSLTIGTVKTMREVYGIEYLIQSFKKVQNEFPQLKELKFMLVGGGKNLEKYKEYAKKLKVEVDFKNQIEYEKLPEYYNMLDIYCAPSISESFGVSILEASSCEVPVIVSNVGGLPEVVVENKTGIIIESKSVDQLTNAIIELINSKERREKFGKEGRKFVSKNYSKEFCTANLIKIYDELINK